MDKLNTDGTSMKQTVAVFYIYIYLKIFFSVNIPPPFFHCGRALTAVLGKILLRCWQWKSTSTTCQKHPRSCVFIMKSTSLRYVLTAQNIDASLLAGLILWCWWGVEESTFSMDSGVSTHLNELLSVFQLLHFKCNILTSTCVNYCCIWI